MATQYSQEFKRVTIMRVISTGEAVAKVARDLGINKKTIHTWISKHKGNTGYTFPGSGMLSPEDQKLKRLEKENRELRVEKLNIKKGGSLLRQEPEIKRFKFIKANRKDYRVAKLCKILQVSRSGYYAWDNRPISGRTKENKNLNRTVLNRIGKKRALLVNKMLE